MNKITVNSIETEETRYKVGTIFEIAGGHYILCTTDKKVLKLISLRDGGRWNDVNLCIDYGYTTHSKIQSAIGVYKWSVFEGSLTITTKKN